MRPVWCCTRRGDQQVIEPFPQSGMRMCSCRRHLPEVYPAAGLINYYRGNKLVLINKSATSYDRYANLTISDSIGRYLNSAY